MCRCISVDQWIFNSNKQYTHTAYLIPINNVINNIYFSGGHITQADQLHSLNPKPETRNRNPKPETLNPKPYALRPRKHVHKKKNNQCQLKRRRKTGKRLLPRVHRVLGRVGRGAGAERVLPRAPGPACHYRALSLLPPLQAARDPAHCLLWCVCVCARARVRAGVYVCERGCEVCGVVGWVRVRRPGVGCGEYGVDVEERA